MELALNHQQTESIINPVAIPPQHEEARDKLDTQSDVISLDKHSLEEIVEIKIAKFLDQVGNFYPENLHSLIMSKVEKPLLKQILLRTGGNQVHAARILGINRNTLRKKIQIYKMSKNSILNKES